MKIYGLHSGDYKVKYVGATTLPLEERLRLHLNKARRYKSSTPVHQWLRLEKNIQIIEIEETDDAAAEEKWIAILDTYRFGVNSLMKNSFEGARHTDASRRKISEKAKEDYKSGKRTRYHAGSFTGYEKGSAAALANGKKVSKKLKGERWQCECGMVSAKSGIKRHQHYSGHKKMWQVSGL